MSTIPQPPEGMQIQVEQTLEGRMRFSWKIKGGWIGRYLVSPLLMLGLVFFGIIWVAVLTDLLHEHSKDGTRVLLICLAGWTAGGAYFIYLLAQHLRRPRPEILELAEQKFIFQPGFAPGAVWLLPRREYWASVLGYFRWLKELKPKKKIQSEKDKIEQVRLQWDGWDWRLFIYIGRDRIEIGRTLKEPEREWLAEIIRAWAKS